MRHRCSNKKGFAVGAIFGGIVGGVTALLFAPKTGAKMRKDISKKYCAISERTQDIFEDVCDQACDLADRAKDIACTAKSAATKLINNRD